MQSDNVALIAVKPHTTDELAALVGYHPETIRRLIREGRIKAKQFGRNWRIMPDEVDRIMAEGLPRLAAA